MMGREDHPDWSRFWSKVDQRGPEECWPWTGAKHVGYGRFRWQGKNTNAHRVAHELVIGPIPEGLHVDHVKARGCTRRDCVNPAHLEAVTPQENTARGDSLPTINSRKTHCDQGHEYTEENTYRNPRGWRTCKTCHYAHNRRYAAERRGST